ncbi:hypothetical protein IEQ34_018672 [Dendrobium chrysotoxum]|uniref:Vesicle transport protein n=1 Tax=Dendrobium chrysotoxum TaxID=161865 RepID=A0AAV7G6G8_DENCH|nr:hypothetical protein IEQ34_018672 [Dendrobium chrysotoxum]
MEKMSRALERAKMLVGMEVDEEVPTESPSFFDDFNRQCTLTTKQSILVFFNPIKFGITFTFGNLLALGRNISGNATSFIESNTLSPGNQQLGSGEKTCSRVQCSLCSGVTGAFRKSTNGEWVHAFCAEWLLESTYKRCHQNLVGEMEAISKEKDIITCCICHNRLGMCLKCSYGHCQAKFYATCARSASLFMNLKAIGGSTAFLIGPKRQFDMMLDPVRIYATAIYISSLIIALFCAFYVHSKLLTLIAVMLEFGALVWYGLSYIPFARSMVSKIFYACMDTEF